MGCFAGEMQGGKGKKGGHHRFWQQPGWRKGFGGNQPSTNDWQAGWQRATNWPAGSSDEPPPSGLIDRAQVLAQSLWQTGKQREQQEEADQVFQSAIDESVSRALGLEGKKKDQKKEEKKKA